MTATPMIRIGTRGSPLALAQAEMVRALLQAAHPDLRQDEAIVLEVITTSGDRFLDRPLADIGGKGLFTKEIDEALLDGRIDLAVHSMKDVPTWLPEGIVLPCMLEREDVRDALIGPGITGLKDLAEGAVVGTASLRRGAQILARRPDVTVVPFRGNVQSRLRKLAAKEVDVTLLAMAGLRRLNMADQATGILEPTEMLPAVAQGAVGITCRTEDSDILARLAPLDHAETTLCVQAERAMLATLDGSCRTPIGGLASLSEDGQTLSLEGLVIKPDGSATHRTSQTGPAADPIALGQAVGQALLERMGPDFLSLPQKSAASAAPSGTPIATDPEA